MVWWIILGVFAFLVISFIGMLIPTFKIAKDVYFDVMVRTSPEKWARENSCPSNEEHSQMFNIGVKWGEQHEQYRKSVSIKSDGLKLCGEYFDLGHKRCAIIVPGRSETLRYCYFFAKPYEDAGYNILVIDPRGHGLSEGIYTTMGVKDAVDVRNWAVFLHDELQNEEIVLHGICIGSCACTLAASRDDFPSYVTKIVVEGIYAKFYESFKEHMIVDKHPVYPVAQEVFYLCKKHSGVSVLESRPIKFIDKVKTPILFLHSKEDLYSVPKRAQAVFDKCKAPKKVVWFDKGSHSHARVVNTEAYDKAVIEFVK